MEEKPLPSVCPSGKTKVVGEDGKKPFFPNREVNIFPSRLPILSGPSDSATVSQERRRIRQNIPRFGREDNPHPREKTKC